jgi:hypothetical protein
MILPRKTETYATYSGSRPACGPPGPRNLQRLPPAPLYGTVRSHPSSSQPLIQKLGTQYLLLRAIK